MDPPSAIAPKNARVRYDLPWLSSDDLFIFNEGSHFRLYDKLGAQPVRHGGEDGVHFAVWAPNAREVNVIGDFNLWNPKSHQLKPVGQSGIWQGFLPGLKKGDRYKFRVVSNFNGFAADKGDPFGIYHEIPPLTASIVWDLNYEWRDQDWMVERKQKNSSQAPLSIYEVHLGSWMRTVEEGQRSLTYRELAPLLAEHMLKAGFTHVEFLPIMEHPFYGSWGYQTTGYFAPTSRFGTPQDFMYLVDHLHQKGIGIILDWVPSHFPKDGNGLAYFDGTHLYEHSDPRQGLHPDWDSLIFNYGRKEVQSFLISSALFWLDKFHVDGLRVDAVASMLYLDYSRKEGEWIPNQFGGNENLEAIAFLQRFNKEVYQGYPDTVTLAEESTAWPMVSRPTYVGGLGFGMKWDMGWMNDTLDYMSHDPIHRTFHHNQLTFRSMYAFSENFVLPLSHDEVVHGKGSIIGKMPGDHWQKRANLRLLFSYMFSQPGKKLLFMGSEIGQWSEWSHEGSVEWHLLDYPEHEGILRFVGDLNRLYRNVPAMHLKDFDGRGFEWIDCNDARQSILVLIRIGNSLDDAVIVALNFTPVPRPFYRIGVPRSGFYKELLNSDAEVYGGSGWGNLGGIEAEPIQVHGRPYSLSISLPPLGAVFFQRTSK